MRGLQRRPGGRTMIMQEFQASFRNVVTRADKLSVQPFMAPWDFAVCKNQLRNGQRHVNDQECSVRTGAVHPKRAGRERSLPAEWGSTRSSHAVIAWLTGRGNDENRSTSRRRRATRSIHAFVSSSPVYGSLNHLSMPRQETSQLRFFWSARLRDFWTLAKLEVMKQGKVLVFRGDRCAIASAPFKNDPEKPDG